MHIELEKEFQYKDIKEVKKAFKKLLTSSLTPNDENNETYNNFIKELLEYIQTLEKENLEYKKTLHKIKEILPMEKQKIFY